VAIAAADVAGRRYFLSAVRADRRLTDEAQLEFAIALVGFVDVLAVLAVQVNGRHEITRSLQELLAPYRS
jgi:hypothetical protein